MKIYMDNNTGNLCLLLKVNSQSMKFTMEYDWGNMTLTANKKTQNDINKVIHLEYTEVGYL
jgi:hypothetical protein